MEIVDKLPATEIPDCVDLLQELLNASRSDSARNEIGELGGITKLATFFRDFISHPQTREYFSKKERDSFPPPLHSKTAINLLRIFRNLCVNSPANQNIIRKTDICSNLVSFLLLVESTTPNSDTRIAIRSGVQFFGNFVTSNGENSEYFWRLSFPNFFSTMITSGDDALREHTLMLLYNCIRPFPKFREDLLKSSLFNILVQSLVQLQEKNDQINVHSFQWIYFILMNTFGDDHFPEAFQAVSEQGHQIALLKILDGMVEKVADELPRRASRGDEDAEALPPLVEQQVVTHRCCSFFVQELSLLYNKDFSRVSRAAHAAHADTAKTQDATTEAQDAEISHNATPAEISQTGSHANAGAAQNTTNEGEKIAVQNATRNAPAGSLTTPAPVPLATSLSSGDYELIYFMLRVLGHVTSLVEECDSTRLCKNGFDLRTNLGKEGLLALVIGTLRGTWELEQAAKARKEKGALFAPGYKRELMGLIANMTYNNKLNQDEVRELGGVQLVLNHCNIDDNNPFIREWALFAVRNLMEDNPENQAIVKGLKAEKVADTHGVMQEMGLGAELVNGVLKFKQNLPGQEDEKRE